MDTPSPKELVELAGISPSYASMILSGERTPPPKLAATIFRKTGVKLGIFANLNDQTANELAASLDEAA